MNQDPTIGEAWTATLMLIGVAAWSIGLSLWITVKWLGRYIWSPVVIQTGTE